MADFVMNYIVSLGSSVNDPVFWSEGWSLAERVD